MPFIVVDPEVEAIARFVRARKDGARLPEIHANAASGVPVRTLRRRLAALVELGALTLIGAGRASRYVVRTRPGPLGTIVWQETATAAATPSDAPKPAAKPASHPLSKPAAASDTKKPAPIPATVPPTAPTAEFPPLPALKTISAARVPPILNLIVPKFVNGRLSPARLRTELHMPAIGLFVLKPGEDVEELQTLVTAVLDPLTAEEAWNRFQIFREAYTTWRQFWPLGAAAAAAEKG